MSNPIFVRGFSRSGGTLMVALLDSHPEIAMSYEQYPDLLTIDDNVDEAKLAERLDAATSMSQAKELSPSRMGVYVARYPRGGYDNHDFARHYRELLGEGLSLKTQDGRLRMMEIGGEEKMRRAGKTRWGMKCLPSNFRALAERWPDSRFVSIIRDARDVAASQMENLTRDGVQSIAEGWVSSVRSYEKFAAEYPDRTYTMIYEKLVGDPEKELKAMMAFFEIPFDPLMLQHDKQDLTIHKAKHVSGPRVAKPIDDTQVGRWRRDLSAEQLATVMEHAGDTLARLGYA